MALRILCPHIPFSYWSVSSPLCFSDLCSGARCRDPGLKKQPLAEWLGWGLGVQPADYSCWLFLVIGDSRKNRRPLDWSLFHRGRPGNKPKLSVNETWLPLAPSPAASFSLGLWNYFWLTLKLLSSPSPSSESLVSMLPLDKESLVMWAWIEQAGSISRQGVCHTLSA